MSILGDTWKVLKGQDLDTPQSESKKSTAPAKKSKSERKAQATKDAKSNALVYATSDKLSKDVIAALADKGMSDSLRNLLEVLCDNSKVREAILSQDDVKPSPDEYYLHHRFINKDTRESKTEIAEKMLAGGMTLDEMEEESNIVLAVVRKRKLDDAEIGEANGAEYDKVRKELKDKYYPG